MNTPSNAKISEDDISHPVVYPFNAHTAEPKRTVIGPPRLLAYIPYDTFNCILFFDTKQCDTWPSMPPATMLTETRTPYGSHHHERPSTTERVYPMTSKEVSQCIRLRMRVEHQEEFAWGLLHPTALHHGKFQVTSDGKSLQLFNQLDEILYIDHSLEELVDRCAPLTTIFSPLMATVDNGWLH